MAVFAGIGRLLRLAVRRDRIKLPVWIVLIVGLMAALVPALKESYPTLVEQAMYNELLKSSAIAQLFAGVAAPESSFGAVAMAETALYIGLAIAFMSTLLVIRHTRHNEELGSSELLQSAQVGRYAAPTAALLLALAANLLVAVGLALVLQTSGHFDAPQAWAYGIGQGLVGFAFAAIAAVCAQLSGTSRGANSLAALAIGAAFLLRGVGDIFSILKDGEYVSHWISWLSPFGWLQYMQPLTDVRWWPVGVFAAFIVFTAGLSYILLARRDVGSGLLPARKGPARASRWLLVASPLGLAIRLQKGIFIGWAIGAAVFALIVGGIADQIGDMVESSEVMQQYIAALGGTTAAIESMLSALLGIIMLVVAAYVVQAMGRARAEEVNGHLEPLLGTALGRTWWLLSHVVVVIIGTAIITVFSGVVVVVTAGLVMATPVGEWQVGAYALAGLSYTPALLIFAGLAVFGIGLYPKFALGIAWLAFAFVAVVSQLGALLKLPDWTIDLSPLSHIAVAPADDIAWKPLLVLSAITLGLILLGLAAFRRRSLQTS